MTAVLFGFLTLFGTPMAFASCIPGGGDSSGDSSSGASSSSSGGDSSDEHEQQPQDGDPEPGVIVIPGDKPKDKPKDKPRDRTPAGSGPVAPAAPVDPGADFVPAGPAPAGPVPVLDQNAVSRGSGALVPAADVGADPGSGGGWSTWKLAAAGFSGATALAGAAVLATKRKVPAAVAPPAMPFQPIRLTDDSAAWDDQTGDDQAAGVIQGFGATIPSQKPTPDVPHAPDYSTPSSVHFHLDPSTGQPTTAPPSTDPGPGR